jgi:hypothetical protein
MNNIWILRKVRIDAGLPRPYNVASNTNEMLEMLPNSHLAKTENINTDDPVVTADDYDYFCFTYFG